jgi:hypothetical protein
MIDANPHRMALKERIAVINNLIRESHAGFSDASPGPITREARGLAIVLLFAAYENLLTSLTRTLLETASNMRLSNRRLQPGFQAFAVHAQARSIHDVSAQKLFVAAIPSMLETAFRGGYSTSINTDLFPSDGSFMKRSQVVVWADTFKIGSPGAILGASWQNIDSIVTQRNGVAHGRLTPQEVGRRYSEREILDLTADWAADWDRFLVHVEGLTSNRDFFRRPSRT